MRLFAGLFGVVLLAGTLVNILRTLVLPRFIAAASGPLMIALQIAYLPTLYAT